jgi:hypothetical protein
MMRRKSNEAMQLKPSVSIRQIVDEKYEGSGMISEVFQHNTPE